MTDLIARLRAHADAHEHVAPQDDEQQQWMLDLREAADRIERLTSERDALAKQAEPFRRLVDACKLLSSESEEFESDDGIGRFVALDYWHEFDDKLDAAINAQLEKEHSE